MLSHGQVGSRIPLPVPGSDEKPYFDLLLVAGLLVERDEAVYFRHQIVQEYLAASALHQRLIRRSPAALLADCTLPPRPALRRRRLLSGWHG
jgi:hypothetical protein